MRSNPEMIIARARLVVARAAFHKARQNLEVARIELAAARLILMKQLQWPHNTDRDDRPLVQVIITEMAMSRE